MNQGLQTNRDKWFFNSNLGFLVFYQTASLLFTLTPETEK